MNTDELNKIIAQSLREDAAHGDVTTNVLIPADHTSTAAIIAKEEAIICGLGVIRKVFKKQSPNLHFRTLFKDGDKVKPHTKVAVVRGPTRALLAAERVALNFLGYLSGIATNTHMYVRKVRGSRAKIFDTRKTTPGLRVLERYAVHCGGGYNHRFDLIEMVLIKDNHLDACRPHRTIPDAIRRIRKKTRKTLIIEVDTIPQLRQALTGNPDIVLLDNMNCARLKKAVSIVRKRPLKQRPLLEASGGITLKNVSSIARTGVNRIAIGALTHTRRAVDVSLELI